MPESSRLPLRKVHGYGVKRGTLSLLVTLLALVSCMEDSEGSGNGRGAREGQLPVRLDRLIYLRDESRIWRVEFGFEAGGLWIPRVKDGEGKTISRVEFNQGLKPDDLFFTDGPMKHRFRFLGISEREVRNERLNIVETMRYAIFEDLAKEKAGKIYEVPNRVPKALQHKHQQQDREALLRLRDSEVEPFSIREGQRFSIPPGGDETPFLMKKITPEDLVVEWDEGEGTRSKRVPLVRAAPGE